MENDRFRLYFLHPKFWLTWLGLGCWRLLMALPYPVMVKLGQWLGAVMFLFGRRRKIIARRNIELCFPDWSRAERDALLRENFANYGVAFFEIGMAWWWSNRRFARLLHIEGIENLSGLNGQGALLTAVHFTTLEIGASGLSMNYPIDAMYRPHNNVVYDYCQRRGRKRRDPAGRTIPRDDIRGLIKALRSGRAIWYAPDQDYGVKQSVFAPFFGVQAATVYATAKLAKSGNARIVPLCQHRLPGSQGYRIVIHPPLEGFPVGDDVADAATINQLVEKLVLEKPGEYMWVHRRFKHRPPGEAPLYPARAGKKKRAR